MLLDHGTDIRQANLADVGCQGGLQQQTEIIDRFLAFRLAQAEQHGPRRRLRFDLDTALTDLVGVGAYVLNRLRMLTEPPVPPLMALFQGRFRSAEHTSELQSLMPTP